MTGALNLTFAETQRQAHSFASRVEAHLLDHSRPLTTREVAEALGEPVHRVQTALHNLVRVKRAHFEAAGKRTVVFRWGPAPQQLVPAPRKETLTTAPWTPPRWSNEIARPGGEAHKQFGSLQADGTVRPYHAPVHGCTGMLKSNVNQGRD
jgi:hypothetical protein